MKELTDWDARFVLLARHVAAWSKDPSTKVGTVLVGRDHRSISFGYNGFPRGVPDDPKHLGERDVRWILTAHAEINALDNARFNPFGGVLYTTLYPCAVCARSIVARGVARVVCPPPPDRPPWTAEAGWTAYMFRCADVRLDVTPP
jgi:dCMP deaminase